MSLQQEEMESDEDQFVDELKPGTELMLGQYTIEGFLAAGGFGITYLARDSLGRPVVIKECFPGAFCRRQDAQVSPRSRAHQSELKSIVRLFSQEATSLAKAKHPNIVGVHQIFEENNTAYMAMDFVRGRDLLEILTEDPGSLTPELVESYLTKILDAIGHIHKLDMLHRDISPDNIIINEDGEPILIDFGAARESTNERVTRMLSALRVVKDGYSPQEFYIAGSEQSPSCDLYSLAASFYHIITGELPPDSQWRLSARAAGDDDPYEPLGTKTDAYSSSFTSGLDKAMNVLPKDRMQSAEEWMAHMGGTAAAPISQAVGLSKPLDFNEKKKSPVVPLLLGTTALAAAAGAAFFFVSSADTDATSEAAVEQASTEPVAPTTVAQTPAPESEAPGSTPGSTVAEAGVAPSALPQAPAAAEPAPQVPAVEPDITPVENVATEILSAPNEPAEQTAAVAPPALTTQPERSVEADPEPLNELELAVAMLADQPPSIDTTPPVAARPVEEAAAEVGEEAPLIVITEPAPAEEPAVTETVVAENAAPDTTVGNSAAEPSNAEEEGSMLDFFMAMNPSEGEQAPVAAPVLTPVVTPSEPQPQPQAQPQPVSTPSATAEDFVTASLVPVVPFKLSPFAPGMITSVTNSSPAWLSENLRIVSIDGQAVSTNEEITALIDAAAEDTEGTSFELTLGFDSGVNGSAFEGTVPFRKENQLLLSNGMRFVSRQNGTRWTTQVAEIPAGSSNFEVGDTLVSFIQNSEDLDGPNSLKTIIDRETENGTSVFNFAVSRNGNIWVESFSLGSL